MFVKSWRTDTLWCSSWRQDTDYWSGKVWRGRAVLYCLTSYRLLPKQSLLASVEDRTDLGAEAVWQSLHSPCYCHIMRAVLYRNRWTRRKRAMVSQQIMSAQSSAMHLSLMSLFCFCLGRWQALSSKLCTMQQMQPNVHRRRRNVSAR